LEALESAPGPGKNFVENVEAAMESQVLIEIEISILLDNIFGKDGRKDRRRACTSFFIKGKRPNNAVKLMV